MSSLNGWPLHLLFWAAFPVLALWNQNSLATPPGEALDVLARALALAAGTTLLLSIPIRSLRRGALATVVVLVPSTLYGYVFDDPDGRLGLVLWGLVVGVGLVATIRMSADTLLRLTTALNVVSLVLVLLNGVPAVIGALDRSDALTARLEPMTPAIDPDHELPDVWYLIPDRYGRHDTLAAFDGVDNGAFVDQLRASGFQVFDRAATNYPMSVLSLASALNMRYLDDLDEFTGLDRAREARAVLHDHELGRLLKGAGYEYVHLGSWADFSQTAATADRVLTEESAFAINAEYVRLSVILPLRSLFGEDFGGPLEISNYEIQRIHGEHQVTALRDLADTTTDHAQFVFGHLILPHGPYVFDADGSLLPPSAPQVLGRDEVYRRQLAFTNAFLLDLVDRLQDRPDPPIIIIQSDEGPLPEDVFDSADVPFARMSDDETHMHNAVLSAVYVPDGMLPFGEDEPVTSVNVIRAAIAIALGQPFDRLEDRSYTFVDAWLGPYRDVTDLAFSSP